MKSSQQDIISVGSRRRAGFSLIELSIALTVLAFGLLIISGAQIKAMQGGQRGRHLTTAIAVATSQMEQLTRQRWDSAALQPTNWTAGVAVNNTVQGPVDLVEQQYTVQWRIANVVAGATRSIDVRVAWVEPDNRARNYVISGQRFNFERL